MSSGNDDKRCDVHGSSIISRCAEEGEGGRGARCGKEQRSCQSVQ